MGGREGDGRACVGEERSLVQWHFGRGLKLLWRLDNGSKIGVDIVLKWCCVTGHVHRA